MAVSLETPGGPASPPADERVGATWLILQRLEDLSKQVAEVKQDGAQFRTEVRQDIAQLRGEMHDQINGLRGEMRDQINGLRGEMHDQINGLRGEMASLRQWSLGLVLLAILGMLAKLLLPTA